MTYDCKHLVRELEGQNLGGVDIMKRDLDEYKDDDKIIQIIGGGIDGEASLVNYEGQAAVLKVGDLGLVNELLSEAECMYDVNGAGGTPKLLAVSKDGKMLIMEYCKGPTLSEFIRIGSKEDIDTVATHIKLNLQVLHNSGYTHNDVHSGNIIVCGTPGQYYTRLIDFGEARKLVKIDAERDMKMLDSMVASVKKSVQNYRRRGSGVV